MRKIFLLLLWLTLLPLAGWAQTVSWLSGETTEEIPLGSSVTFPDLLNVVSASGNHGCTFSAIATAAPSGNVNQYNYQIYNSTSATTPFSGDFQVGQTYYVRLFIRHQNGTDWYGNPTYASTTVNKPFKITKGNVTVTLYSYSLDYGVLPTKGDMSIPGVVVVSGATDQWSEVEGSLTYEEVEGGTDVGTTWHYKLNPQTNTKYNISVDASAGELTYNKVVGKLVAPIAPAAENLVYTGEDIPLVATPAEYQHNGGTRGFDGNPAGTVEYSLDGTTWDAAIPTGKNVATYTVYYRGVGDGNHLDLEDPIYKITVNITRRDITTADFTAIAATDLVYTSHAQKLLTAFNWTDGVERGIVEFSYDNTTWYSFDNFKATDAGHYPVYVKISGDLNHYGLASTKIIDDVTIDKADLDPQDQTGLVVTNLVYSGADQKLLNDEAVLPQFDGFYEAGTFEYFVDGVSVGNDWNDVVGKDADEDADAYVITYTFVPTSTNFNAITEPQTIGNANIAKADFTITTAPEAAPGLIYNALDQVLLKQEVEAEWPAGTAFTDFTVTYTLDGTDYNAFSDVKGKDAQEYEITWAVAPNDTKNFNTPAGGTVIGKIGKKGIDIAAQSLSLDYGEYEVTPGMLVRVDPTDIPGDETLTEEEIGALLVDFKDGWTIPDPQDAGVYPFELEPKVIDNYEINDFVPNGVLTINTIDATPATVTAATLIYNGADQELVTIPDPTDAVGGTMLYYLETEETGAGPIPAGDARWSEDIPVATKAGEYNVWTMIKGDKNHNDVVATAKVADVKIAQKALDIAMFVFDPATLTAEYDGSDLTPAFTIATGEPMVEADYELAKTNSAGEDVTEMVNVDTYTFTFTGAADGNYTGTVTADFTITPKALADEMFTLSENVTYNGEAQQPTISTGDEPIVEADYTIEVKDSEGNVVAIDALVDADTYTFNFIAAAGGNYSGSASAEWTIGQKDLDIAMFTLSSYEEVYDGTDLMPDFTFADGTPSVLAETDFTVATTNSKPEAVTEMIDADTYTFTFTAAADGNYKGEVSADFVIKQDEAEFVLAEAINLTYKGADQALVTEAETDAVDGKVEYALAAYDEEGVLGEYGDFSEDIPQARNAGKYSVKTKFTASEINYTNPEVFETVDVTINKATIGYNLSNLEKVWDGELFGEEEIAKLFTLYAGGESGMLFDGDEYDKPFTLTLPEDYRDAGTYTFKQPTVEFKEGYPVNYNVTFAGEAEIIINKADIKDDEYTAPAAISGLVYDFGTKMDLVTPGSVDAKNAEDYPTTAIAGLPYGTILFATAEDGEYTEDVPQGDHAGEYDVWFKIAGDINHNDTKPVKITNTIATYELSEEFLPEEYKTELPYKAAAYEATDFIPALDGIELDEGYEVYASEMKDAGEYEILYKGINNLSGEFTVTVNITPLKVIATAPNGTKVYDGTASLEGVVSNEDISFNGLLGADKLTLPETLALTTEGINASEEAYAIKVDAAAINDIEANKNYIVSDETIDGQLTITKAPAFKVGFDEVPAWSKVFGEEDPDLTGYTVQVTDGEFFDNIDDVLAATTAKRAEGEDVGTYDVTLEIDATAEVFANYEGVAFDETAAQFEITKSDKTYTVSLTNITETYTGEEFATAIEITAENLVIAGYDGDKAKFFTTLPTATLAAGAKDAGDYNITLSDGESQNFKFEFIPATFTIEPFEVTVATIENQKVQKGKALDVTKFTITAPEADADLFYVTAPGLVDMDDIVTGEAGVYADGLTIAVDESVADNYVGLDKFTAELEIIAADAIVLADDEDFVTEDKEGVDVTFASRTLNAGTWNVVALPFEATIAQISNAFGYAAVDILDESNKKTDEIHFMITTSGSIPAYTPFIVKTTDDEGLKKTNFDQVVFHNVNLEASEGENKAISDGAGNQFIGTFKGETTFWGKKYRYMSKGAWYNAAAYTESNPVKIKAFRGYIEMVKADARIFIEEPDGTVTAIDAVNFNKAEAEGMYNLNGVKVNNANRKGVFIQNGKKVINK